MKRILLMLAAVIGLIMAGGALAGTPLGSHPGALRTDVASARTAPHSPRPGSRGPRAPAHALRATGGVAHRHITVRRLAQGGTLRLVPGLRPGVRARSGARQQLWRRRSGRRQRPAAIC